MTRYIRSPFRIGGNTHAIDAREPWPPKDGLGKDLPKELSAAYWFVSDIAPQKFPYPDEVQSGFCTTST